MVDAHESHKLSLRQACILFSICFSVYTYKPKPKEDSELRDALAELAAVHTRWGIWMMHHRVQNLGSPYQNGYVERFNKSYREEVLDAFTFRKLGEATALTQAWLWMYNNERPHVSLGYKSPVDFVQERLRSKAPQTLMCDSNFHWKSLVLTASN